MSENDFIPYRRLASRIILQAVDDCSEDARDEVADFLQTDWFESLADIAGVEPESIRLGFVAVRPLAA